MSQPDTAPPTPIVRRAKIASLLGTTVEAYDFYVYSFLVAFIAPNFFPAADPVTAVLSTLLIFGAGFLTRPLGGVYFGRMGDRRGRRTTLIVTVTLMGGATFALGLLPTYAQIGLLAPILLVLVRLLQGFSAGGELMGAATYVAEHGQRGRRGRISAITPVGFQFGAVLAPAVVWVVSGLVPDGSMASWGWRVPLLLSLPLTILVLLLRNKLEDSPEFQALAERKAVARTPVRELVRLHRVALLQLILLSGAVLLIGYVAAGYLPTFLATQVKIPAGTVAGLAAFGTLIAAPVILFAGYLIDRTSRRAAVVILLGGVGVLAVPALLLMLHNGDRFPVIALCYALIGSLAGAASVPVYSALTGLFPARVRYSGAAIGFGLGAAIGGGSGPYLAGFVASSTGNPIAPGFLIAGVALIGILVALTMTNSDSYDEVPAGAVPSPSPADDPV
ncbi:MFS transporter [Pseudonocardia xishanensis]|uniref:Glycine betaine/L-proline transporter ProP n=1 Tax=Pseudonocardia xishanensis TaxID=630995 RepID=A0ABP8S3G1_9PSEU